MHLGQTVNEKKRVSFKETIDDDEIKEEINVEDDSEEEYPTTKLRKKFLNRISNHTKTVGKSTKTFKMIGGSHLHQFLDSKGKITLTITN